MHAEARYMLSSIPDTVQLRIVNDIIGMPLLFASFSMLTPVIAWPPAETMQFSIVTSLASTAMPNPPRRKPLNNVPAPVIETHPSAYDHPGPPQTSPGPVPTALSTAPGAGRVSVALGCGTDLTDITTSALALWAFASVTLMLKL